MSFPYNFIRNIFRITLPSLIFVFLILEIFFRYVIPATQVPYAYYDRTDQILRFDTSKNVTGVSTIGNFAETSARWRINNFGWNSNIDYYPTRKSPLIAIIGDSYVEAFQVDVDKNFVAIIREKLNHKYDVYSFGFSGWALSDYLQLSRYVNKHFNPDILAINVVHNDFSESLCYVHPSFGTLCLKVKPAQISEATIIPYHSNIIRRTLSKSSVVRYLYINLNFKRLIKDIIQLFNKGAYKYSANVDLEKIKMQREDIMKATNYVLKKLKKENPNKIIIIMMDAPRKDIYENNLRESKAIWLNNMMKEKCKETGIIFIDLTKPFSELYSLNHVKYESPNDGHWNEYGHRVAAEALYNKLKEMKLF